MTAGARHPSIGELLARIVPAAGRLTAATLHQLDQYVGTLLEWNQRINLTGARTAQELVEQHVADALFLLPHLPDDPFCFVDVGSGNGLPGLVLRILRPDAGGVLLEPVRKKHAFLAHAIRQLQLQGLRALPERLERHLETGGAGRYDLAVSRATWPPEEWLELARPLIRPGGRVLAQEAGVNSGVPPGVGRHPYLIAGRRRAVLVLDL